MQKTLPAFDITQSIPWTRLPAIPPSESGIDRERVRAAVKGGQRPAQRTLDGCVEDEQETHNDVGRASQARPVCAVGFAR